MRVLYSFPDEIGRPGIGTTALNQVREIATSGADVMLYCGSLRGDAPENVRVVRTMTFAGRRVPHRALGIERAYRYHDLRVAAALRRIGSSIDVVHCWSKATTHTCRVAHKHGVKCLREVTNTHTAHAVEVVAREAESLGLASLESRSHDFDQKMLAREEEEYVLADALLVPSEFSMQTFLDREIPREKLVLHHYGYDSTRFFEGSKSDGPFTAIFVGRCEPRKGLHYALRAWIDSEASADGRFVICGAFEPKYREVLEPLLAHPSVEIRGFVSDVAALMRDSDVLVLPSVEEGSALVTYEAQACGCVLLVSEPVGAICQHEIDALVHSAGDVKALAEHFTRLYRDRDLLGRLREATLLRAEDLSWSAAGRQLLDIYAAQVGATPAVA